MIIALVAILMLSGSIFALMAYNRILPIGLGMHRPVFHTNNIALDGYDATSYFNGKLEKGNQEFSSHFRDVTWNFSSEANIRRFNAQPDKFVPQFGGYCTKAVSTGFTAPSDPKVYAVRNQKLFLFSSQKVKDNFWPTRAA